MNKSIQYFDKAVKLLDILNENGEMTRLEIANKMSMSKSSITSLINEFNREEIAINRRKIDNNEYLYSTNKKSLKECKSYETVIRIILYAYKNIEEFYTTNENEMAKKMCTERKIIQKVKTLIKGDFIYNKESLDNIS